MVVGKDFGVLVYVHLVPRNVAAVPDIPIIMLTGHGERSRVIQAIELGVNEFLLKPVSSKALRDRIIAVMTKPRPLVKSGDYYGPAPRKLVDIHQDNDDAGHLVLLN